MKTLLEKIWNGEYKPSEENVLHGEEVVRATRILDAKERELWERLDTESRELFDKVMAHYYDMIDYYKRDSYIKGAYFAGALIKELLINGEE